MRGRIALAALLLTGCYTTHAAPDASPPVDAGPCAAPARAVTRVRAEVLSAAPAGCARVGTVFERRIDLRGTSPLTPDCAGGTTVVHETADGCGLVLDAECFGVELERYVDGTLRGVEVSGDVRVYQRFGYSLAECDRLERWRRVD